MSRAAFAPILWFAMMWFGWEVIVSVVDLPRSVGPLLGFIAAAIVTVVLWHADRQRTTSSHPLLLTPTPSD